jgi:O-antigen ligase
MSKPGVHSGAASVGIVSAAFAYSTTNPAISASTSGLGYATHNTFLEILVEGGLLAFVPFFLHFMTQWPRLAAAWRATVRHRDLQIGATLVGLPVVMVSAAFANVALHYSFWAVCGLAMAGANVVHAERRHDIQAGVSRPETGTGWQPSA